MRIRLSDEAREFLRDEARYLRDRSPAAARRLLERMSEARKSLAGFPFMGSQAEDSLVPGTRRLVVGEYVLNYDAAGDAVEISTIRHGRMARQAPDVEEDFDYEADPSNLHP